MTIPTGEILIDLEALRHNIDVLTAQQTYQTAALTLIRARAARYADTIALFAALGGGWWNRNDMPPPPPGLLSSPLP